MRALQSRDLATEPGFASELNLRLGPWLAALAAALDQALIVLIDYGYPQADYYRAERRGGTLMCHARHRAHTDPYRDLGLQDITAHVDFTAVAEHGAAAGLALGGYTTQALFLIGCGLDRELAGPRRIPSRPWTWPWAPGPWSYPRPWASASRSSPWRRGSRGPGAGSASRDLRARLRLG